MLLCNAIYLRHDMRLTAQEIEAKTMSFITAITEIFSYPFLRTPLIVGILVSLCAALLGSVLVLKRFSMIGDGINDGKFVIKKGGLSQAIASELGLNEQQVKQIGSIWSKIFAEVDKQQDQNLAEGKSAIYSGGNDLKGSANENYKVFAGQAVEFSKEIWANIVKLVNDKLKTNIQVDNSSSNPASEPTSSDVTTFENSVNNEQETDTSSQEVDNNITMGDLEDFFKSIKKISPQGIAQDLIDEIFGGRANLDEIMPRINADNVLEVLDEYKKLSDEKNTKLGVKLDDETLIEAILDETILY